MHRTKKWPHHIKSAKKCWHQPQIDFIWLCVFSIYEICCALFRQWRTKGETLFGTLCVSCNKNYTFKILQHYNMSEQYSNKKADQKSLKAIPAFRMCFQICGVWAKWKWTFHLECYCLINKYHAPHICGTGHIIWWEIFPFQNSLKCKNLMFYAVQCSLRYESRGGYLQKRQWIHIRQSE